MSYLTTFGPAGDPATRLGWGLGLISIAVTVIVTALLLAGLLRRRQRADPKALAVASDTGGMAWIYVGTGITTVILLACAVWTIRTISAIAMPVGTDLSLEVSAAQWWWRVRYDNADPSQVFDTANEIHIPVGRPVRVELESLDVIHSFWIPKLGGKMDVIPGRTNVTWLEADAPGVYRGQCGEYCGAQHAHMALSVVADPPATYAAWVADQLAQAPRPASSDVAAGLATFSRHCAACHAVRGTDAGGILGPDLTHLMSRSTLAAGTLPNTPANLLAWLADSQAIKPGCRMPRLALSARELQSVARYLQTLQ
ncbi:MAG: cytochrome c oxidase subunit II [Betaproteobacteria bacterium]